MDILWKLEIILSTIVFGIWVGVILASANNSKKVVTVLSLGYGTGILLFILFVVKNNIFYQYNYSLSLILAVIGIYLGTLILKRWKTNDENVLKTLNWAPITSSLICFFAFLATVTLILPSINVSDTVIAETTAVILISAVLGSYITFKNILKIKESKYPILIGNLMLIIGFYLFTLGLLVPQIKDTLNSDISPLSLPNLFIITYVVIGVLVLAGYLIKRDSNRLVNVK